MDIPKIVKPRIFDEESLKVLRDEITHYLKIFDDGHWRRDSEMIAKFNKIVEQMVFVLERSKGY